MSANTVALVGALVYEHPELLPILEEHLQDYDGEVLPHLLLSDVVRWMIAHRIDRTRRCIAILAWLEAAYERGNDDERDLIVVSGVEMIPDPGEPGSELRALLGPQLTQEDPWSRNG